MKELLIEKVCMHDIKFHTHKLGKEHEKMQTEF